MVQNRGSCHGQYLKRYIAAICCVHRRRIPLLLDFFFPTPKGLDNNFFFSISAHYITKPLALLSHNILYHCLIVNCLICQALGLVTVPILIIYKSISA